MSIFLRAKHWQLFLLTIVTPIVLYIIGIAVLFASISQSRGDQEQILMTLLVFIVLAIIISTGTLMGWFYALGTRLPNRLPSDVNMPVGRFKLFFFIPLIYLSCVVFGLFFLFSSAIESGPEPPVGPGILALIIPMHFFSIFCIFHTMYFVAKSLKGVLLQREVHFSDYAGEFFLIWFYFVGIWFIQPKVNEIFSDGHLGGDHFSPILDSE
jgi:hypothetical protein